MSGDDIESVTKQLSEASVDEQSTVSYAGKGFKLNNEGDGEWAILSQV